MKLKEIKITNTKKFKNYTLELPEEPSIIKLPKNISEDVLNLVKITLGKSSVNEFPEIKGEAGEVKILFDGLGFITKRFTNFTKERHRVETYIPKTTIKKKCSHTIIDENSFSEKEIKELLLDIALKTQEDKVKEDLVKIISLFFNDINTSLIKTAHWSEIINTARNIVEVKKATYKNRVYSNVTVNKIDKQYELIELYRLFIQTFQLSAHERKEEEKRLEKLEKQLARMLIKYIISQDALRYIDVCDYILNTIQKYTEELIKSVVKKPLKIVNNKIYYNKTQWKKLPTSKRLIIGFDILIKHQKITNGLNSIFIYRTHLDHDAISAMIKKAKNSLFTVIF